MKITIIKNTMGLGFGYFAGDTPDLKDEMAQELIKLGYAKKFVPERNEPESDLPEDIPGYDVLMKEGITTVAEVKAIDDLTEIKGIGKVLSKEIKEFLK